MIKKKYQSDKNFDIIINLDKGDLEIIRFRKIVDDNSEDIWDLDKITLSDAKKIEPDFEVGEEVAEVINLDNFGRRAINVAKQSLFQKIKDHDKNKLINRYEDLIGELITCEVYQILKNEILLIDDNGNEISLPLKNKLTKDYFKKGDFVKAIVDKVDIFNNRPKIILSRTNKKFIQRLFEYEIPEIYDGLISVKYVERIPGIKTKIVVESYDDRIDPVGTCIGTRGSKIQPILKEIKGENIDVINFTNNFELYVKRLLSPAKIEDMKISNINKEIEIYLNSSQISLAIGKNGQNINLASKILNYKIDIYSENNILDEDVDIDEFSDEIDYWIINELKKAGFDTAKNILSTDNIDLCVRCDLEIETVEEIKRILNSEFEK